MGSGLSSFIEDRFIVIGGRIVCDGEESVRVGLNPPGASVGLDVARSGDAGAGRVIRIDKRSLEGAELDGVGGISGNGGENSFLGNSLRDNFNFHATDGVNSEIGGDGDGDIGILDGDISGEVCIITRGDAANGDAAVTIGSCYVGGGHIIAGDGGVTKIEAIGSIIAVWCVSPKIAMVGWAEKFCFGETRERKEGTAKSVATISLIIFVGISE